jgi:rhodanese-related sulfurtransferase
MLRSVFCIVIILFLFGATFAEEQSASLTQPDLKNIIVLGPYCGIYSLCACLETFDKKVQVKEFLTPDYVGSFRGSTAEELIKAAEKHGIHGKCYANITWRQIKEAKCPMILHFRDSNNSEFNHWVAFLGIKGNHVRIMDTPHELAHLTMAELLALWDGVAIILSEKPVHNVMFWQAKLDYFWCVLLVIGCGIFYKTYFWNETLELSITTIRRKYWWKLFSQTVSLLVVCGFVAITYHVLSPIGFLNNPSAVAEVTRRYYAVDVPEIAISEMQQLVEQKSAVIYDTRYRQDFVQGAIPGAISLPINSNLVERKQILQGIDNEKKIVLYCQSSGCRFSDSVATFLKFNGYYNISIFRGGYREWENIQKATKP